MLVPKHNDQSPACQGGGRAEEEAGDCAVYWGYTCGEEEGPWGAPRGSAVGGLFAEGMTPRVRGSDRPLLTPTSG